MVQPADLNDSAQTTPAPPCAMVIFGAAGDLTRRLLVPSLYNLARNGLLPKNFTLIGVDRVTLSSDDWCNSLKQAVIDFAHSRSTQSSELDQTAWALLVANLDYLKGDILKKDIYSEISSVLEKSPATEGNALFYLAIGERFFQPVVEQLGAAGLVDQREDTRWRRVIIEKPFGHDLKTAQALNAQILSVLTESQVYRIDHYLGKETVQNIMVFRFANGIFEPIWNRDHIDHIQITVAETVGVEHRGAFYEHTGALRDMVPNHLFQLLSMVAMEPPNSFNADAVRNEKVKVLEAAHLYQGDVAAARGQYDAGTINDHMRIPYRQEPDVDAKSTTETYAALKVMVDNWRWGGMPYYLRTGKALGRRTSEIVIQFKSAPFELFRDTSVERMTPNRLVIHIQPDEGVSLEFCAKAPGTTVNLGHVSMNFNYRDYFDAAPATGYETLLYDCMIGDPTLFQRADAVEAGWAVVQPLLDRWTKDPAEDLAFYSSGSDGPANSDALIGDDGRQWHPL